MQDARYKNKYGKKKQKRPAVILIILLVTTVNSSSLNPLCEIGFLFYDFTTRQSRKII